MPFSFSSCALASLPVPETIRTKAAEVVARPEFQLESEVHSETLSLWLRLLKWFLNIFNWLTDLLSDLPHPLWWLVVIGLAAILVMLIVHIVWSLISSISRNPRRQFTSGANETGVTAEEMEQRAERAESDGDYIGAIRLLFRASLVRIERSEQKPIRRGITNWELLRRYRMSPLVEPLTRFVQTIDAKWYGHDICVRDDCLKCRTEYSRICGLIERRAHAVGA